MARTIVSKHMLRRTAERKQAELQATQERAKQGNNHAKMSLAGMGINPTDDLDVRKEGRRFFKWAVVRDDKPGSK